jgi:hypothetical protein
MVLRQADGVGVEALLDPVFPDVLGERVDVGDRLAGGEPEGAVARGVEVLEVLADGDEAPLMPGESARSRGSR